MKHWSDGLPLWQKRAILITSPVFWIGWVLIGVGYLGMMLFLILTHQRTLPRNDDPRT